MKRTYGQRKYVFCTSGEVVDFAVDLRIESPNYLAVYKTHLRPDSGAAFIPNGFAHGFLSLEDQSVVTYLCDNFYDRDEELSINPLDETLGLQVLSEAKTLGLDAPILSSKDSNAMSLDDALRILQS
jgi:dTDP-4-dehydrorhamnose 3,5-epimerase